MPGLSADYDLWNETSQFKFWLHHLVLVKISIPQFLYLQNGDNNTDFIGFIVRIK